MKDRNDVCRSDLWTRKYSLEKHADADAAQANYKLALYVDVKLMLKLLIKHMHYESALELSSTYLGAGGPSNLREKTMKPRPN